MKSRLDGPPAWVLQQWSELGAARVCQINSGLINATYSLDTSDGHGFILQRLHPVFSAKVNLDMAAITEHLAAKGILTPRLVPTRDAALWVEHAGEIWRLQTRLAGVAHTSLTGSAMARQAGRLVGRFHVALADLRYEYQAVRTQVHDTPAHMQRLQAALQTHPTHRLQARVAELAECLLQRQDDLQDMTRLPMRHAHGDLKISNLLFDAQGVALALIDLDTLALMHWPLEMGDALRSWCNPRREDQLAARLDLALLAEAVQGYRQTSEGLISADEWQALIPGLARICLELSARFLADALNENYFGWDAQAYPARGEHNLARGASMWALYTDVMRKRREAERLIEPKLG